jgi:hypothetical protein
MKMHPTAKPLRNSFLDKFGLSEPAGLLLLDVDIAVTAPLVIPDRDRIAGKIVVMS